MIVTIRDTDGNYNVIDSFEFYQHVGIYINILYDKTNLESIITTYKEYGSNYFAPSIKRFKKSVRNKF